MPYQEGSPRSMKVFIAHESPDAHFGAKVGGAAAVALNQARELKRMGRQVELIGPKNGGTGRLEVPNYLFEMPEVGSNDELIDIYGQPEWMELWREKLKDTDAECDVYTHYVTAGNIGAQLNGEIRGKMIHMGHSWDRVVKGMDPGRKITGKREGAESAVLQNADAIIVATQAERAMVARDYSDVVKGGGETLFGKTHVVPLGVDSVAFEPQNIARLRQNWREKLLGDNAESVNFYSVGRMSPQKNQLGAVRAFGELLSQDPKLNASLSLFGGPLEGVEYVERVKDEIASLPIEVQRKIMLHGVQPGEIAHSTGDILVGNSVWETFFLVAAEAMAAGRPTIISRKPILQEVAGEGTLYIDETNIHQTASAMHKMATDESLRDYSSAYNFMRAWERYTWQNSARKLDQVWQNLR